MRERERERERDGSNGQMWTEMDHCGLNWIEMDCSNPKWTVVDQIGPKMLMWLNISISTMNTTLKLLDII